jgi:ABC-type sugar transport system substrate-binding protein
MRKTKTRHGRWQLIVAVAAATAIGAATLVGPATIANAQTASPGAQCKTLGKVVQANKTRLICGKVSGRQKWERVLSAKPVGSTNGQWVRWNASKCAFEPAAGPRNDRYIAYMRKSPANSVYALGTQGEGVAIQDALNNGWKAAVKKVGAKEVFANYRQSEIGAAGILEGARAIALRRPQAVTSWAGIQPVLPTMMDVYKPICAPVVQVTFPVEGSISFGSDNATVGREAGKFLVDYLKEKRLDSGPVTAVGIRLPSLGADLDKRISGCTDGIKRAIPSAKISNVELGSDQFSAAGAQTKMSDWFTANPASSSGTVVICTIADIYAVGAGNAAKSAGRTKNVFSMGVAGSDEAVALIRNNDPIFVGSIDFKFQDWGQIIIPLMQDSLEGKVVPRLSAPNVSVMSAKTLR